MIKVNVSENSTSQFLAQTQPQQSCFCTECSTCVFCVVFAPIVGIALGPALGIVLSQTKS